MDAPITDADRLQAKGVPITLDNGQVVRIRFDMEALKELEKHFGDLEAIVEELKHTGWRTKAGTGRIETIRYLLWATMLHLEWENGIHKHPGRAEQLSHLLDSTRLLDSSYLTALNQAMLEALPKPTDEDLEADASPNMAGSASSLGNGSTLQPLLPSGVPTASSGV